MDFVSHVGEKSGCTFEAAAGTDMRINKHNQNKKIVLLLLFREAVKWSCESADWHARMICGQDSPLCELLSRVASYESLAVVRLQNCNSRSQRPLRVVRFYLVPDFGVCRSSNQH